MTFPVLQGITGSVTNTPSTSHNVAQPATVNAGDLLLASLEFNADTTVACPGGEYTRLSQRASSPGQWELWGRIASGSEDGTNITFTTSASMAGAFQVARITGHKGGLVAGTDYSLGTATGTTSTANANPDPPSVTAAWGTNDNLFIAFTGYRGTNVAVSSYPASYTSGAFSVSTNGGGGGAGVAMAIRALASTTDNPGAFTLAAAQDHNEQTIVIRPATTATNASATAASASFSAHNATATGVPAGSAPAQRAQAAYSAHNASVVIGAPPPPPGTLTFPDAPLGAIVEAAFGADLNDPLSWSWTDLSGRLLRSSITIRRGEADEASDLQPSSVALVLDNGDGELMPGRATSSFYPYVRRGTPLRVRVEGAESALRLNGEGISYASTPDHPSFDVTDLDIRIRVLPEQWAMGETIDDWQDLIGRWDIVEISWLFNISDLGRPHAIWSTNGASSTNGWYGDPLIASLRPIWLGQTIDVDDGAGNHVVSWWRYDDQGDPPTDITQWTLVQQLTKTGTTSLAAVNAPLAIGRFVGGSPLRGLVYQAEYRSGINGTILANPDFSAQTPGTVGFLDSTGKLWSLFGEAEITRYRTRFTGSIDEIVPYWPYGDNNAASPTVPSESRVSIVASDFVRRLGQGAKPFRSSLYRQITSAVNAAHVLGYWSAEEERDSTQFSSALPDGQRILTTGVEMGADDTLVASAPLPSVEGGSIATWNGQVSGIGTTWAIDFFVKIPTLEVGLQTQIMAMTAEGDIALWRLLIGDGSFTVVGHTSSGAELINQGAAISDLSNRWLLIRFKVAQGGTGIDWSWVITDISAGTGGGSSGTATDGTSGRITGITNTITAPPDGISFGHIVVTDGTLATNWLAGADTGWVGESAAHRFWRLCREEGIRVEIVGDPSVPTEFRGDLTLSEPMGPQQREDILALLNACQVVDMGIAMTRRFVPGFLYRCRTTLESQPTPFLALDAANEEISVPLEPRLDDQRIRNDMEVTSIGGATGRYADPVSVADEGPYQAEVTINGVGGVAIQGSILASQPGLAAAMLNQNDLQAAWRVHLGTWPGLRYPTIVMDLAKAPHLIEAWHNTELGDRITIANLPSQHPTGVVELIIEAFEEVISPTSWEVVLTCGPGGAWQVGVLDE